MRQIETIRDDQIGSDGRALRKYEIREELGSSKGFNIAVGLLISNAVLVIKNIFFSGADEYEDKELAARGLEGNDLRTNVAHNRKSDNLGNIDKEKQSSIEQDNVETIEGYGANFRFSSGKGLSLFDDSGIRSTSSYNFQPRLNTGSHTTGEGNSEENVVLFPGTPLLQSTNVSSRGGGGRPEAGMRQGSPIEPETNDEGTNDEGNNDEPEPRNRLPVLAGPVILSELYINQSIILGQSQFLENAFDPDGDVLTVQNVRVDLGTLNQNANGNWKYIPNTYDLRDVEFSYEIFDGTGVITQVALLSYIALPGQEFFGMDVDDLIVGTAGSDHIDGFGGDDTILAREDSDIILGGAGNDKIEAGQGDDVVYGGLGDDVIFGGSGNDLIFGGEGHDRIFGGEGDDSLFGNEGDDHIFSGAGNDRAFGGEGDDELFGNEGDDFIDGEEGNDKIDGGSGNDTLVDGAGEDEVNGGGGDDRVVVKADGFFDTYDGGTQIDTLDLSANSSNTIIDMQQNKIIYISQVIDDTTQTEPPRMPTGEIINHEDHLFLENVEPEAQSAIAQAPIAHSTVPNSEVGVLNEAIVNDNIDVVRVDQNVLDTSSSCFDNQMNFEDPFEFMNGTCETDEFYNFENVIAGQGNDVIIANDEANSLTGNGGQDWFVFETGNKSGKGGHVRDRIEDFEVGDKIDVSLFDGNSGVEGLQKLVFKYDQVQFDGVGQILCIYEDKDTGTNTILRFNFDEDDFEEDEFEFEIEIVGRHEFTEDNLIT